MHNNDSITEHFAMNVISLCSNIGTAEDVPDLGLHVPDLTTTGVTAAPRAFIMRNNEAFSVLSDAWQWFHHRTFRNECDFIGRYYRRAEDVPDFGLHVPVLTRAGVTAAQLAFIRRNNEALSVLSDA